MRIDHGVTKSRVGIPAFPQELGDQNLHGGSRLEKKASVRRSEQNDLAERTYILTY